MNDWKALDISELTGPFAAQEYLQALIRSPEPVADMVSTPKGISPNLWQFEHIRYFIIELNLLLVPLINEGLCTQETCPKMKATDTWLYLCACHAKPQDCCAIDYMIHSLDHATNTLNDKKNFKDRLKLEDSC